MPRRDDQGTGPPDSSAPRPQLTRRRFLSGAAAAAAGGSMVACFPDVGGKWPVERDVCHVESPLDALPSGSAPVAEVHDEASVSPKPEWIIDAAVVPAMVHDVLSSLAGGAAEPWPVLLPDLPAGARIGIKVNCLNQSVGTSVPVVRALVDGLKAELGASADDIIVWDRRLDELTRGGYTQESVGAQVVGTINSLSDASGPGYEEEYCDIVNGKRTHLSRILTELTDVTINCPVLKTHGVSGVTAAMKNVYGVIDNPGDFHDDLNTALPAIYNLEPVRTRLRLTVVDALRAAITADTHTPVDTAPRRILASRDPLACDNYALALANELRALKLDDDGNRLYQDVSTTLTSWLDNAYDLGLGHRGYELIALAR